MVVPARQPFALAERLAENVASPTGWPSRSSPRSGERRLAERVGFEPTCPFGQDAFEAPPLRPLLCLLRSEPSSSLRARGRLRRLPSGARLPRVSLRSTRLRRRSYQIVKAGLESASAPRGYGETAFALVERLAENVASPTGWPSRSSPRRGERRLAERVGFEPTCPFGQDAFEAPPLRPLRYLSVYYFARWGPFSFPISLRARGRLRRLPSGARLRPQALTLTPRSGAARKFARQRVIAADFKKRLHHRRHSSSSTPPTAIIRWFSDGCSCARMADSIAPAFGSRAPNTRRAIRAWTIAPTHIWHGSMVT